jgi:hypothetical protein
MSTRRPAESQKSTKKMMNSNKIPKKELMWRAMPGGAKWKRTWKLWIALAEILSALAGFSAALEVLEALVA